MVNEIHYTETYFDFLWEEFERIIDESCMFLNENVCNDNQEKEYREEYTIDSVALSNRKYIKLVLSDHCYFLLSKINADYYNIPIELTDWRVESERHTVAFHDTTKFTLKICLKQSK